MGLQRPETIAFGATKQAVRQECRIKNAEQFADLVVSISETISLFFSLLNLVGVRAHHFFAEHIC